jgi:hypothetical protein
VNHSNEPLDIEVFDLNGRKVISQKSVFDSIDVSFLSEGIYSLKLLKDGRSVIKKLIIK